MGVSFYSVLEYERWGAYWAFGRLEISRDHELFSALAFGEGGITDGMPYPPRGLPHDCSLGSIELFLVDAEEVVDGAGEVSPEAYAEEYGEWAVLVYRTYKRLPMPETYSHSWLNLRELTEALAHCGLSREKLAPDFRAVLAAMHSLADDYGAEKVRFVFCFGM